jgi:hypothetical protein
MRGRRRTILAVVAAAAVAAVSATAAHGALIVVPPLVLHADGDYKPHALPRHHYAPIEFDGHANVKRQGGGVPAALERATLEFDRDGLLTTRGLPVCRPAQIEAASPAAARKICRRAQVGEGRLGGVIALPVGLAIPAVSPLTLFNGPRVHGRPSVLAHAQLTVLGIGAETFTILIPIERAHGEYRYKASVQMPEIAGGYGVITTVRAEIGRRFRSGGKKRSYVSARCTRGLLQVHGEFDFADGTIMYGEVSKPCTMLG